MSTNGASLGHPQGVMVSFTGPAANTTQVFNLPSGYNVLHLSQIDTNNPTEICLTDAAGNAQYFNGHAVYPLGMPGPASNNPITLTVLAGGSGIDGIFIGQHNIEPALRGVGG